MMKMDEGSATEQIKSGIISEYGKSIEPHLDALLRYGIHDFLERYIKTHELLIIQQVLIDEMIEELKK